MEEEYFRDQDSDSEVEVPEEPKVSEKRRFFKGLVAQWIKQDADKEFTQQTRGRHDDGEMKEEDMTIQELLAKRANKKIIESPRDYQMELFERAKQRNTLAVLDTGSGKTLIAALLIRWMLDREIEHRAQGGRRRLVFFIVAGVALAFQQHAVLQCNLSHKIEKLYGHMNVDWYTPEQWRKIFTENMGIVCTADILYHCLTKSFLTIADINLLIFDEAHHAKKEHSFSNIMREFYHKADKELRPRVFGMTASPVDAKVDVVDAARELEALLDAQIATSKLLSMSRPKEQILRYQKVPAPYSTALCRNLQITFAEVNFFNDFVKRAQDLTAVLGEWCGDEYWKACFREDDGHKLQNLYKRHSNRQLDPQSIKRNNEDMLVIERVRELINSHTFPSPLEMNGVAISSKVQNLLRFLDSEFENPTESKCIVFVSHRLIAFLLVELFKQLDNPHLRCAAMVGNRASEVGEIAYTLKTQLSTLSKFEKGEFNCLFATTVAEEGIDIADCNIIIRFDLYNTMIQYVQSRGRARHHNSKYIHMLEKGNFEHDDRFRMALESEQKMRDFVEQLPADRLLLDDEDENELRYMTLKEKVLESYKEPSTGAMLTYRSSQPILHHFVDCLPIKVGEVPPQPTYVVQPHGTGFMCEIVFPENCLLKSVVGKQFSRKILARQSAAFHACVQLRQQGLLDAHLLPKTRRLLPAMRNAQLALDEHKGSTYKTLHKPRCWGLDRGTVPNRLFVTVLGLSNTRIGSMTYRPFLFLTRRKITEVPSFPLWPQSDQSIEVLCTRLDQPLEVDAESLTSLTSFTLKIFMDVFNKEYEHDKAQMSYWIAPCMIDMVCRPDSPAESLLDWQVIRAAGTDNEDHWTSDMPPDHLVGRYIVDPGDGSRRYLVEEVAAHLQPSDKPPENVAPMRAKFMTSIWDYTNSTWGQSRVPLERAVVQPVLKAYLFPQRRNMFEQWDDKERKTRTLAYICPEPLRISSLAAPIATMAYLLPAIVWRIESHLIAQEACQLLGLHIEPGLALEALTKDSDNSEEHRAEQINFRAGMGRNYERLEFLGDCFLKTATTISLYTTNDGDDEYSSHVNRMLMICNKNLFQNALKINLQEYIRAETFSRRLWYPEGLKLLKGKGSEAAEANKKRFSDKTIADICEAFIGAALWSHKDTGNMDMAVKAVSATVVSEGHKMQCWKDYHKLYRKPHWQSSPSLAVHQQLVSRIAKIDGYRFRCPRLLQSAFTHPTYPYIWDHIPNYQRLEFLGDALLDLACVRFLYSRYPDQDPQWLTEHKMALVSNKFLGALSVRLGFNFHMRSNDSRIMAQVKAYCEDIAEAEAKSQGAMDYWTEVAKDPPKCLADIVESYVGALFVDSEYSFQEVERFFRKHIAPYFQDMSLYDAFANNHPIVALANMLTETYNCHDVRVLSEEISSMDGKPAKVASVVIIHDEVVQGVWSTSTRYGKIKAAHMAKAQIEGLAPYEYRCKYGCDCKFKERKGHGPEPVVQDLGSAV